MITFLIFILATIGLTNILVHGKILEISGIKPFLEKKLPATVYSVFECYECSGFWAGMFVGALVYPSPWWMFFLCGLAGSVVSQTFTDLLYWLRSKTSYEIGDGDDAE